MTEVCFITANLAAFCRSCCIRTDARSVFIRKRNLGNAKAGLATWQVGIR